MAQKIQFLLIDDIDESPAEGTVEFSLDGTAYEIDLNRKHSEELHEALAMFVRHARKVGTTRKPRISASFKRQLDAWNAAARQWAKDNGRTVKERGRVPASVATDYMAATGNMRPVR